MMAFLYLEANVQSKPGHLDYVQGNKMYVNVENGVSSLISPTTMCNDLVIQSDVSFVAFRRKFLDYYWFTEISRF